MSYETVNVDSPLDLPLHGCWEIRLPPPKFPYWRGHRVFIGVRYSGFFDTSTQEIGNGQKKFGPL